MAGEGFYRVTISALMYSQSVLNVLSFLGPVADLGAQTTLANEVTTIWINQVKTLQGAALNYVAVKVEALGTTLPPHIKTINIPGVQQFDNELDPCNAFIIRLRTGFAGRTGRGRVYIASVMKGFYRNGLVTQTLIDAWDQVFGNIMGNTGFGSSPYILCVGNKSGPLVFHPVMSLQVAPTLGHQRRRNIGVGI